VVHERAVEVAPARPHHILKAAPRASAFGATKATRGEREREGGPAAQRASYINALPRHRGATILLLPSLASCLLLLCVCPSHRYPPPSNNMSDPASLGYELRAAATSGDVHQVQSLAGRVSVDIADEVRATHHAPRQLTDDIHAIDVDCYVCVCVCIHLLAPCCSTRGLVRESVYCGT